MEPIHRQSAHAVPNGHAARAPYEIRPIAKHLDQRVRTRAALRAPVPVAVPGLGPRSVPAESASGSVATQHEARAEPERLPQEPRQRKSEQRLRATDSPKV